jgi:hypothetical protein
MKLLILQRQLQCHNVTNRAMLLLCEFKLFLLTTTIKAIQRILKFSSFAFFPIKVHVLKFTILSLYETVRIYHSFIQVKGWETVEYIIIWKILFKCQVHHLCIGNYHRPSNIVMQQDSLLCLPCNQNIISKFNKYSIGNHVQ